jgi:hypothetical protein
MTAQQQQQQQQQQHQNAVAVQLQQAHTTLIPLNHDISSAQFFQPSSDGSWTPQLTFDISSAGLHTLIPTLHPAHIPTLSHQLTNGGTPNSAGNTNQALGGPNNGTCSTVFHMGLGQYMSDQEHFKNLFTV